MSCDWRPFKRGNLDTDIQREVMVRTPEEMAIFKLRRKAWNKFFPQALGRKKSYRHLDLRLLTSFQNCENKINFCCLSHP